MSRLANPSLENLSVRCYTEVQNQFTRMLWVSVNTIPQPRTTVAYLGSDRSNSPAHHLKPCHGSKFEAPGQGMTARFKCRTRM